MCDGQRRIDRIALGLQLADVSESLKSLSRDVESGALRESADECGLAVKLGFVLSAMCFAWQFRHASGDGIAAVGQADYERASSSVPNWGGRFRLAEAGDAHPLTQHALRRRFLDRRTMSAHLRDAVSSIGQLAATVAAGNVGPGADSVVADALANVLRSMCLAWHLRYLTPSEEASLGLAAIEEMGTRVPPWAPDMCLVDPVMGY